MLLIKEEIWSDIKLTAKSLSVKSLIKKIKKVSDGPVSIVSVLSYIYEMAHSTLINTFTVFII